MQSPEAPALCCVLGKKLELPNSQLQNIWVTLCSWIPGHTLCLAPTRSYWMFLSSHPPRIPALFQVFLVLPVPQQDTPCPTHKAENIQNAPNSQGFQALPFPVDEEAKADPQSLHTEAPMEDTLRNHRTAAPGPKCLLRLPSMRTEPCRGWELLQPLTRSPTTPSPPGSRHRRAQGPH